MQDVDVPKTEIEGKEFQTEKYNPEFAYDLLGELGELAGGPLGQAMTALAQGSEALEDGPAAFMAQADGDLFGRAVREIFTGLNQKSPSALMKKVLKKTDIIVEQGDGKVKKSVKLNRDFDGDLFAVFPLLAWVLEVNYQNFLHKLTRFAGARLAGLDLTKKSDI